MPSQYFIRQFKEGHFYHIYNHGLEQRNLFINHQDYQAFTDLLGYHLSSSTAIPYSYIARLKAKTIKDRNRLLDPLSYQLISYCLMPDHFHLLLHQSLRFTDTNSIPSFIKRICVSYTMYFNKTHKHTGTIFQGKYKSAPIPESQLPTLTKFIHLNPLQRDPLINLHEYPYSSYRHFLDLEHKQWLHSKAVFNYFPNRHGYQSFVEDSAPPPSFVKPLLID